MYFFSFNRLSVLCVVYYVQELNTKLEAWFHIILNKDKDSQSMLVDVYLFYSTRNT